MGGSGSASALARNDPTLLAKSDPAPPTSGCRISGPTKEDHARVQTSMRAQCGESERSHTSPFSDAYDRMMEIKTHAAAWMISLTPS